MLVAIWHMLTDGEVFDDLGSAYYDQRSHDRRLAYYLGQREQPIGAPIGIPLHSVPVWYQRRISKESGPSRRRNPFRQCRSEGLISPYAELG